MEVQKNTMITTVIYSKEKGSRYLLTKQWDKNLPKATIIMLMPGSSGVIQQDVTTCCIINCMAKLGFGCIDIINLFSKLNAEISTDMDIETMTDEENNKVIIETVSTSTTTIIAWGKCDETNLKIKKRAEAVIKMLEPYRDRLYVIGDGRGRSGFSPMYPRIRNGWELVKLYKDEQKETRSSKKSKKIGK